MDNKNIYGMSYDRFTKSPFYSGFENMLSDNQLENSDDMINRWHKQDEEEERNKFNLAKLVAPFGAGIAALTQSPGTYYVQANWKGNGLANTGLGYTANPNYANPYDVGQMLSSLQKQKDWRLTKDNIVNAKDNTLNRLANIRNGYGLSYDDYRNADGLVGGFISDYFSDLEKQYEPLGEI